MNSFIAFCRMILHLMRHSRPKERPTATIEIYTRPGCGYCTSAKLLLGRKKAAFTEFDIATDPTLRQQMWDRAGAGSTFPQIFIGQTPVGGCDELYALDRAGKLDALLAGEKPLHERSATP
jgi:glutaredoxin 3